VTSISQAAGRDVSRETIEKLEAYASFLRQEAARQNLIAASTLGSLWDRHIVDSAQLVRFEPFPGASWIDIGAGAGLPGIVVACLVTGPVTLAEPRRLRADFLNRVAETLQLDCRVVCGKAESLSGSFDVITARAVARLDRLLEISSHLSTGKTVWALPKGRSAQSELVEARTTWQGAFHVERSITDADSYIVIGQGVRRR
jgi:16S rRNA (guanine527-N7)-methyltransferase